MPIIGGTGTSVNNTLNSVPSGSYTVTVSDANGCTLATTVNIPNQVGPVVSVATLNNVTCFNGNDGNVNVGIAGDNPFNYVWSNGASTAANSNLVAGNSARVYHYRCFRMYVNVSS